MNDEILICYDGSDEARHAIEEAGELLSGGRAIVLNVGSTLTWAEALGLMTRATLDFDHVNAASAQEVAEQGAELARRAGFEADPRGGVASPVWEAIVTYAEIVDAPLIVLGARALNGVGELVKGSVSHKIAEHAGRPVLVVPHSHDE
jgi:nucleotide-binding universal stress UspA family protein